MFMDERTIQGRLKRSDTPSHRLQIHREHLGPMCKLLKHLGNMLHPYLLVLRVKSKERRTLDRVLLCRHFWDLRCQLENVMFSDPENQVEAYFNVYYHWSTHMAKPTQTLTLAPAWRDIIIPEPSEANRPPQHGKRKPRVTTFPRDVKNVLARYLRTCEVFLLDVDTFLQALPPAVKSRQWALTEKIRRILVERQKHLARARQLVKHDVSSSNQRVWGIVSTAVVRREPAQTKLPPEIIDYVSKFL